MIRWAKLSRGVLLAVFFGLGGVYLSSCGGVEFEGGKEYSLTGFGPETSLIVGLASPIQLDMDSTRVRLDDWFTEPESIDSAQADVAMQMRWEGNDLWLTPLADLPPMSVLTLFAKGREVAIPMKRNQKQRHRFSWNPHSALFKSVEIKGEFNRWQPKGLVYDEELKRYSIEIVSEPGQYQYKMVIDGNEVLDKGNPDEVPNGMGGWNNLLTIGSATEKLALHALELEDKEGIAIGCVPQKATKTIVLLDNKQITTTHFKNACGSLHFTDLDAPKGRSHLRLWTMDDHTLSNELLIPLENGRPIVDSDQLTRHDLHSLSLYNVFVDRFKNGDSSNDAPVGEPAVLPIADNMGGDIKGAIQKLEEGYFKELGINTIWISPVVKNVEGAWGKWPDPETAFSAYHGYWPISFTEVDERLTTEADLHELVQKAHEADMNVLLDFVANHVHEDHPFYVADTTVATDMILPDGRRNLELWDEQRLTTWFDTFLPSLRLDEPRVYEMMTDSAVYWIDTYDLDGFRHDAAKHVPEIFWKTLTRKLKERVVIPKNKPLYQVGETYGSHELVASYVNSGQLDAQFDFNAYDALVSALATDEGSFIDMDAAIHKSLRYFGDHHLMGNITGNQDKARFISYAGGALGFEEKPKVAGWSREVGVGEELAYDKLKQLIVLTATLPGIPVIYYGDEIGSYGAGDPDNRKMMRFDGLTEKEEDVKKTTAQMLTQRRASMPLMYGDFKTIEVTKDLYVFSRTYLGQTCLVTLNKGDNEVEVEIPTELLTNTNLSTPFTVDAHSFDIQF